MLLRSEHYAREQQLPEGWHDAVLKYCELSGIDFEGRGLEGAYLNCSFVGCSWYWSLFVQGVFVDSRFRNCRFDGVTFSDCKFVDCNIRKLQLRIRLVRQAVQVQWSEVVRHGVHRLFGGAKCALTGGRTDAMRVRGREARLRMLRVAARSRTAPLNLSVRHSNWHHGISRSKASDELCRVEAGPQKLSGKVFFEAGGQESGYAELYTNIDPGAASARDA